MSKRRQCIKFVTRATIWGIIVGAFSSIPLMFILWVYGYLGFLIGILYTILIGLLNGVTLGTLTFYHPADNEKAHRRRMLFASIGVSIVGAYILFFPIMYPLMAIPSYTGEPRQDLFLGYGLCIAPIAFGTAFIASFASLRVKYRSAEALATQS
jgi:hypothetical protein